MEELEEIEETSESDENTEDKEKATQKEKVWTRDLDPSYFTLRSELFWYRSTLKCNETHEKKGFKSYKLAEL